MPSLFVLIFALSMIACGDGDRQPDNQSTNPLYSSGPEQVQRGQIVTVEGASVSEAEVVIIDVERLVVLARVPVDDQGGFVVSVPQRPSYWLGVSGPYMTTYIDTAFAFTGEAITVGEPPRSHAAGKAAQVVDILGDVNNDNQVDIADALLVLLYTLERFSFVAPNQGNIFLGDVNQDGRIDIADVLLIMTYIANSLDPMLPTGIGVAVAVDQDRAVLIELYGNWGYNTDWLISTYPLDQWYGVTIDDEGRVTSLDLSDNQLTGTIPEALGQLNNLQVLDLSGNQLTGTIPEALGHLENLEHLSLVGNELTGCIPSALQSVPSNDLDDLGLGLAFCHLESDEAVVLAALYEATGGDQWEDNTNWLSTAPLSEWDGVTTDDEGRVTRLYLSVNQLTGTIPEALGQLEYLEYLDLSYNELTGPIPETLGHLEKLQDLNLSYNELTGPIPETLGHLENLLSLGLSVNQLTGPIPETLGHLEKLEGLFLDSNQLTGSIPEILGHLEKLRYLNLAWNQLTGSIPEILGHLEKLRYLDLSGNQLTGSIPEILGQLEELDYLDLSGNQLTGPIPEALAQLDSLGTLLLARNELTGCIPSALQAVWFNDLGDLGLAFCQ